MKGKRLLTAAEVVLTAGKQIESMLTCLETKMTEALSRAKYAEKGEIEEEFADTDTWICEGSVKSIPLYENTRKKSPYAWLGFQATIYDEEDISQVNGWEPSLYVMYSPGDSFGFGAFNWSLNEFIEPSNRIFIFPSDEDDPGCLDSWCFVLPLTEIGTEKALEDYIVTPVINLLEAKEIDRIKSLDENTIFSSDNPAFRFHKDGDIINILR
jgi:hypothetical protein